MELQQTLILPVIEQRDEQVELAKVDLKSKP